MDKGSVRDQFRLGVDDLCLPPALDLASHWLEIPLDATQAYRECVDQVEALGVLGQDGSERAGDIVSEGRTLAPS